MGGTGNVESATFPPTDTPAASRAGFVQHLLYASFPLVPACIQEAPTHISFALQPAPVLSHALTAPCDPTPFQMPNSLLCLLLR